MATSILVISVYRTNDFSAHDVEPISVFAHIACYFVIFNLTVFVTRLLTAMALKDRRELCSKKEQRMRPTSLSSKQYVQSKKELYVERRC